MKRFDVSFPQLGLIAATRGMAGAGIGLLLADKLGRERRQAVGWTLLAVGALTTIPLVLQLIGESRKSSKLLNGSEARGSEEEMVEAQI